MQGQQQLFTLACDNVPQTRTTGTLCSPTRYSSEALSLPRKLRAHPVLPRPPTVGGVRAVPTAYRDAGVALVCLVDELHVGYEHVAAVGVLLSSQRGGGGGRSVNACEAYQ